MSFGSLGLASLWSKFARLSSQYHVWRKNVGGAGGDDDCSCGEFHLVSVGCIYRVESVEVEERNGRQTVDGDGEKSRVDG